MEPWIIWIILGLALAFLEVVVPGGVLVFLGLSAVLVGAALHFGLVDTLMAAFTLWFITSIVTLLFLRSLFMKFFEGDSSVQNVNEEFEIEGSLVEVVEDIHPYKEGRVRFRDTTWMARSEEEIGAGQTARILRLDGNCLIVQSL